MNIMPRLHLSRVGFKSIRDERQKRIISLLMIFVLTLMAGITLIVYAEAETIPMTGFAEFDAMYNYHMNKEDLIVDDVMVPVNNVIFVLIKLQMRILGSFLLLLSVSAAAFAIWYAAKPEFADEVSEVKMRVANGEKIPFDEIKEFFLQFMPDIKANSGIADSYEYERPTIGLLMRDHLLKFVILFAIAIALMTNVITTFIVKTGNALAYGAKYYTESTDFVGIVRTMTTAGKDFDPRYDTLTAEGRNKKKIYNAIYNSLKDAKPRDRTTEFLERIGQATANEVAALATNPDVKIGYANFTVSADIVGYDVEPDISTVKMVIKRTTSQLGMEPGVDIPTEKYVYIQILQYAEAPSEGSPYGGAVTGANAWVGTPPTAVNIGNLYTAKIGEGYKFVGKPGSLTATAKLSDGTSVGPITLTASPSGGTYNINLAPLNTAMKSKINATVSLNSINITGMNGGTVTLKKDGSPDINTIPNALTWTKSK